MYGRGLLLVLLFPILIFNAQAQEAPTAASTPKPTPRPQGMKITYGSSPWNTDSTQADSAFLFLKDKKSGKVVKILLDETEPDSSVFSGRFSVRWNDDGKVDPEVYIPPQNMRAKESDIQNFSSLINKGKVKRMPVITRVDENGNTAFEVYDTKEQAEKALKIFKEESKLRADKKVPTKYDPSESTLDAARLAARQTALQQLALATKQQELERLRLEQIERQKTEKLKAEQAALSAAQRKAQEEQAAKLAKEAMAHYQNGEFPQAEDKFRQSLELDPSHLEYYFQYAISLYRNEKFNEALVYIKLSPETQENRLEQRYYRGLIHYRLKEVDSALANFSSVKNSGDKKMAAPAAFYEGIVLMGLERYEEAKASFEFVLDNSDDPKMDEQAEAYIERIIQLIAYQRSQKKKLTLTGSLGITYDSNVTFSPDNNSDQGTVTDQDSFRIMALGDVDYRWINLPNHEFNTKLSGVAILSLDESFVELDSDLGNVDPYLTTFVTPYTYKGTIGEKGYKLAIKPGYELLYMDAENEGSPSQVMSSVLLGTENTLIMRDNWFSSYILDLRLDDSSLSSSVGDDNLDSTKITLKTNQSFFLDKSKKEILIPTVGYTLNSATGKNKTYNRIDAGVTYMQPTKWENTVASYSLALYKLSYSEATTERNDFDISLTGSLIKSIRDGLVWTTSANYTLNNSDQDANQYSKYSVLTLLTWIYEK